MLTSSVAWVDFAEKNQRKMVEVISLFRERDTRDELGLGSIRDAFADLFFPGTSTIQTRARYFLFVPWTYLYLEERRVSSNKVPGRLKGQESRIIRALRDTEEDGVIGRLSGAGLQRFPSSIYWNGLQRWGIRRFPGSQSQYHRWLDHFYDVTSGRSSTSDLVEQARTNWDPHIPPAPDRFPDIKTLRLRSEEARYLRERLLISCPDSLLATLVEFCEPSDVSSIWQHPQLAGFPDEQRTWIDHAHKFSETMYGAVILYNLMLAECRGDEDLQSRYKEDLRAWWEDLNVQMTGLAGWDRCQFWDLVQDAGRIPVRTKGFVNAWLDLILASLGKPRLEQSSRYLVRDRETWLKRGRSRFESRRHLEMWSGRAGLDRLDFRWPVARDITNDVLRALREGVSA